MTTSAPSTTELGFDPDALREKYRIERDKRLRDEGNEQYVEVTGRGRQDRGHVSAETPKHVFVYLLERDWRRHLDLPRRSSAECHSATSDRSADW